MCGPEGRTETQASRETSTGATDESDEVPEGILVSGSLTTLSPLPLPSGPVVTRPGTGPTHPWCPTTVLHLWSRETKPTRQGYLNRIPKGLQVQESEDEGGDCDGGSFSPPTGRWEHRPVEGRSDPGKATGLRRWREGRGWLGTDKDG